MSKQEFLTQLRKALLGLPQDDIDECLAFYSEMIDDRVEEGLSQTEAVLAAGSIPEIVEQVVADISFKKIAKERIRPKRHLGAGEITLLILGSPIWGSLGIGVIAIILSIYVVLWSVIISLWAVFVAFAASTLASVIGGVNFIVNNNTVSGITVLAAGLVCAGLSIFVFYGCKTATKGILLLTKKIGMKIKNLFIKKEEE